MNPFLCFLEESCTPPGGEHMTVKILPNERGNPPGKLADAELHFTSIEVPCPRRNQAGHSFACDVCDTTGSFTAPTPLEGLKLIGFMVWERRGGAGKTVTFPARQYSVNGERRSFALLRPIEDAAAQDRVRDLIIEAYDAWAQEAR